MSAVLLVLAAALVVLVVMEEAAAAERVRHLTKSTTQACDQPARLTPLIFSSLSWGLRGEEDEGARTERMSD